MKWIFGVAAGAVFFALAAWFWSLGAIASEGVPAIRVEARQPGVEVRRQGMQDWRKVEGGLELMAGDTVRTDAEGLAEIRWGDLGVTRLDASSELTVEELPLDISDATKTSIRLHLASGRAWSRLLKLYGPEASFEARTDSVVATVRGTAFGLASEASSTRLAVTESVVEAQPTAGGPSTWVKQGKGAEFDALGYASGAQDLPVDDAWVNGNKRLDEEFDKAFRAELEERFKKRQASAPEWLVQLSEGWHLNLAYGDKREGLATAYAMRRISSLAEGKDAGCRKGVAVCGSLEKLALLGNRGRLLSELRSVLAANYGRLAADDRMWLRNLRRPLMPPGSAYDKYGDILGVWERNPAAAETDPNHRTYLLDLTRQIESSVGQASGFDEATRTELEKDIQGLYVMLRWDGGDNGNVVSSTEPLIGAATSTEPARNPATVGAKQTETGSGTQSGIQTTSGGPCVYTNLTFMAKPTSGIDIGAPVGLTLLGTCPDGRVDDVTARATFNPSATADGRVVGSVFYPARSGEIFLYGNYFTDGKTRIAQAVVNVNASAGKKPASLKVTPLGPTTIASGQSSAIQAIAIYDDRTATDVTSRCVWSSSDPRLADVFSNRVQVVNGTGEVTITCTFSENGASVSDSQLYTVILDPSLSPTGVTKPNQYYQRY